MLAIGVALLLVAAGLLLSAMVGVGDGLGFDGNTGSLVLLYDTSGGGAVVFMAGFTLLASAVSALIVYLLFRLARCRPPVVALVAIALSWPLLTYMVLSEESPPTLLSIAILAMPVLAFAVGRSGVPGAVVAAGLILLAHLVLAAWLTSRVDSCSSQEDCFRSEAWTSALGVGLLWFGVGVAWRRQVRANEAGVRQSSPLVRP